MRNAYRCPSSISVSVWKKYPPGSGFISKMRHSPGSGYSANSSVLAAGAHTRQQTDPPDWVTAPQRGIPA